MKSLIAKQEDTKLLQLLSSFSCELDEDIEFFLHNRAIEFENLSKSRTYLVFDEEEMLTKTKADCPLTIYGYFSIALYVLKIPSATSNRIRKELDGFNAKIHNERINEFPCYLIGQLARATNVSKCTISGDELVKFACDVIESSVEIVGGRYIVLECRDDDKLISFYEKNKFRTLVKTQLDGKTIVQMIRKIK